METERWENQFEIEDSKPILECKSHRDIKRRINWKEVGYLKVHGKCLDCRGYDTKCEDYDPDVR